LFDQFSRLRQRFLTGDDLIFLLRWLRHPTKVGAVAPSGRALSESMVGLVDWSLPGYVVELGAGMGAFTRVLLERTPSTDRLVIVERDPLFFAHLQQRFPNAPLVMGDATKLTKLLARLGVGRVNAVVSGLPLLSMTRETQRTIIAQSLAAGPDVVFIQFTYGFRSPVPKRKLVEWGIQASRTGFAGLNVPPAWVWCYRWV